MALHAVHVQDTSKNVVNWATQARDKALETLDAPNFGGAATAKAAMVEAQGLLDWALNGKDGSNAPVIDGGGAITAYQHSQLMAGYSPVFSTTPPSGLQAAAPPAAPPEPPSVGDGTVAVVVKMGLIAGLILVSMGGLLLVRRRTRRLDPAAPR